MYKYRLGTAQILHTTGTHAQTRYYIIRTVLNMALLQTHYHVQVMHEVHKEGNHLKQEVSVVRVETVVLPHSLMIDIP